MNFHILTLFPDMIINGLSESITGRALKQNKISIEAVNIRDFSTNKHHKVDDYTYGGGAGMLMQAQPVYDAWKSVSGGKSVRTVYVTPQGAVFNQSMAEEFAKEDDLIILCGHYEGIDERVLEEIVTDYVSIGDYVLTGGELASMVMVDAISRLVPGVLHNEVSAETESFHGNLLEYPQYSRPEVWHDKEVPQVLMSGNQREISKWRLEQSVKRTKERRPDLFEKYETMQKCKEVLMRNKLLHIDMIEFINRGTADLVHFDENEIIIRDIASGAYFHSLINPDMAEESCLVKSRLCSEKEMNCLIIHQDSMIPVIEGELGMHVSSACRQYVFTRKEKLPIKGLYRADGKPMESGLVIKVLTEEYTDFVVNAYDGVGGDKYVRRRIAGGNVIGAFINENLVGFAGLHEEGSLGMIYVVPSFRNKHIGMALETYLINLELEKGNIPFVQVKLGNDEADKMQEKLGLFGSKTMVFWME